MAHTATLTWSGARWAAIRPTHHPSRPLHCLCKLLSCVRVFDLGPFELPDQTLHTVTHARRRTHAPFVVLTVWCSISRAINVQEPPHERYAIKVMKKSYYSWDECMKLREIQVCPSYPLVCRGWVGGGSCRASLDPGWLHDPCGDEIDACGGVVSQMILLEADVSACCVGGGVVWCGVVCRLAPCCPPFTRGEQRSSVCTAAVPIVGGWVCVGGSVCGDEI